MKSGRENPMSENYRLSESIWNATRTFGLLAVSMTFTAALSTDAFAQESAKTFGYYTNANTLAPDSRMSVVNPGSVSGFEPAGDRCANIYVFSSDQQMLECCSCKVTPDGLLTLSVNTDLTNNSLTSAVPRSGAIKIVSSAVPPSGLCESVVTGIPTITVPVASTAYTPSGLLGSWITHANDNGSNGWSVSETNFFPAALAENELHKLQAQCDAIALDASGHGICTCGSAGVS